MKTDRTASRRARPRFFFGTPPREAPPLSLLPQTTSRPWVRFVAIIYARNDSNNNNNNNNNNRNNNRNDNNNNYNDNDNNSSDNDNTDNSNSIDNNDSNNNVDNPAAGPAQRGHRARLRPQAVHGVLPPVPTLSERCLQLYIML